jgi:hypothetical protein
MSRETSMRPSRPTLLPTAALELLDRGAVRDAIREVAPTITGPDAELLELLDAIGSEAVNTLHLAGSELSQAVDRDLQTSRTWQSGLGSWSRRKSSAA